MNIKDLVNQELFVAAATKIASVKLKEMGPGGKALGALAVGSGLYYGGGKVIDSMLTKEKKEDKEDKDDKAAKPIDKVKEKVAAMKSHLLKKVVDATGVGMPRGNMAKLLQNQIDTGVRGSMDSLKALKGKWGLIGDGVRKQNLLGHIDKTLSMHKGPGMVGNKARAAV